MNFQKNEISKHSWDEDHTFNLDEKIVPDRESTSTPRKIKETIHSLKKPNHFNKISYMLLSTSCLKILNNKTKCKFGTFAFPKLHINNTSVTRPIKGS